MSNDSQAGTRKGLPKVDLASIHDKLKVSADDLAAVMKKLTFVSKQDDAEVEFHYVQMDSNGKPRTGAFLKNLNRYIKYYAIHNQRWDEADEQEREDLRLEARQQFRDISQTGELGELILFCLIEARLRAPQAIARLHEKTESQMELPGADAVHVAWDESRNTLILYWGEAKLEQNLNNAAKHAFESLHGLFEGGNDNEDWIQLGKPSSQLYSGLDAHLRAYVNGTHELEFKVEEQAVVFIGFNEAQFEAIEKSGVDGPEQAFIDFYTSIAEDYGSYIHKHRPKFSSRKVQKITAFILPFESVDTMRDKFKQLIAGERFER